MLLPDLKWENACFTRLSTPQFVQLIDNSIAVGVHSSMKAELRLRERIGLFETTFVILVIWRLPALLARSSHQFKYRLALADAGVCVLWYDNEAGKGDHKNFGPVELDYSLRRVAALTTDFWADVEISIRRT